MCGRYTLYHQQWVDSVFGGDLGKLPDALRRPRYNIAPGQLVLALRRPTGASVAEALYWGVETPWRGGPSRLINARAEKLAESRFWRPLLDEGRCAIAADGFYEWRAVEGAGRQPYWFGLTDGEPFAFAGLRRDRPAAAVADAARAAGATGGDEKMSPAGDCVIVTVAANELVAGVHDRMPAMLDADGIDAWLEGDVDEALAALRPYPSTAMTARPVAREVNDAANDGPQLINLLHSNG